MPGFDPHILREEERISGFDTVENDDTFFLERIPAYPGKEMSSAEGASHEESSAFSGEPSIIDTPVAESIPQPTFKADYPEEPGITPILDQAIPTEQEAIPVTMEDQPPSTARGRHEDPMLLDEDLMSLLREDLEKSKSKKKPKEEITDERAGEPLPVMGNFSNEERQEGEGVDMDLSAIEAEHPSTYRDTPLEGIASPLESDAQEKKRKKFALPFSWTTAGVALLALTLLGGTAYYYWNSYRHTAPATHGAVQNNSATSHPTVKKDHNDAHAVAPSPAITDSEKSLTQKNPEQAVVPHTDENASQTKEAVASTPSGLQESRHETPQTMAHTEASAVHTEAAHSNQATTQPVTTPKEKAPKELIPKTAVPKEAVVKEKEIQTPRKQTLLADRSTETKVDRQVFKKPVVPSSPVGEYVVQVYSSPSADDAGEWLEQLRQKNVSNAFITTQSIRGQTWHRVRFGTFATREEAEAKALQVGFSNSWIVRVR